MMVEVTLLRPLSRGDVGFTYDEITEITDGTEWHEDRGWLHVHGADGGIVWSAPAERVLFVRLVPTGERLRLPDMIPQNLAAAGGRTVV